VAVTVAPGIIAPLSSFTCPLIDAVCAHTCSAENKKIPNIKLRNLTDTSRCILTSFARDENE
jgi:hypothetical protein